MRAIWTPEPHSDKKRRVAHEMDYEIQENQRAHIGQNEIIYIEIVV